MAYVGEIASVASAVMWAGALCVFRGFGRDLHATTLNVFKNGLAIVLCLLTWAIVQSDLPASGSQYTWLFVSEVVGFVIGDTTMFASLRLLGARFTALLQCLFAPATVLLGWLVLGEELSGFELSGVVITLVAVVGAIRLGRSSTDELRRLPRTKLLLAWTSHKRSRELVSGADSPSDVGVASS